MAENTEVQMNGTAAGLMEFLDWTARTGLFSSNTAASYRTAVTKVLEIDGETWTDIVISELDIEQQIERFTRLRASRYNPKSIGTYGNRFRAAIEHYQRYLDEPKNFRGGQVRLPKAKATEGGGDEKGRPSNKSSARGKTKTHTGKNVDQEELIEYPFPLSDGTLAKVLLPRVFRRDDATRFAQFVSSLAVDPILQLHAGPGS
jgi:hypothetical protein